MRQTYVKAFHCTTGDFVSIRELDVTRENLDQFEASGFRTYSKWRGTGEDLIRTTVRGALDACGLRAAEIDLVAFNTSTRVEDGFHSDVSIRRVLTELGFGDVELVIVNYDGCTAIPNLVSICSDRVSLGKVSHALAVTVDLCGDDSRVTTRGDLIMGDAGTGLVIGDTGMYLIVESRSSSLKNAPVYLGQGKRLDYGMELLRGLRLMFQSVDATATDACRYHFITSNYTSEFVSLLKSFLGVDGYEWFDCSGSRGECAHAFSSDIIRNLSALEGSTAIHPRDEVTMLCSGDVDCAILRLKKCAAI